MRLITVFAAALIGAICGFVVTSFSEALRINRPYGILTGLILGAVLVYAISAIKTKRLDKAYRERLRVLSAKLQASFDSAEERYAQAQKLGESIPVCKHHFATLHLVKNETMRSVEEFRQAEAIGAKSPAFYNNFGVALARVGNRPQAISALEEAATRTVNRVEPYVNIAHAVVELDSRRNGSTIKALDSIKKARQIEGESFEVLEREALVLLHDGQFETAKEEFSRALEQVSEKQKQADVRNHLGIDYLLAGQYSEAANEFRTALSLDPGHARAQCNMGLLAFLQNRPSAGLEAILQANLLELNSPVMLTNAGFALCVTNACNEGIKALRQACAIDVTMWEAFFNLGKLYTDEGLYEPARNHLQHIIDVRPHTWQALTALGVICIKSDEHVTATELLRKAYELAPHEPTVITNLGIALTFVFEYDEAERLLQTAVRDDAEDPLPLARLAWMHVMQGMTRLAVDELIRALKLAPKDPAYNNYYGLCQLDLGAKDVAILHFRRALKLKPDYHSVHYHIGYVHMIRQMLPEAIKEWEQTVNTETEFVDGFVNLGVAYYETNDLEKAADSFRKALILRQDRVEDYSNLALTYSKQGVALKKDSKKPEDKKGKAAHAKFLQAIEMFDKALEMRPDNVVLHSNRGLACWYADRVEEAAEEWTTVAHLDPEYAARRGHLLRSAFDETSLIYMPLRISDRMFGFPLSTPSLRFRIAPGYDADRWNLIIEDEELAEVPAMREEVSYIERNLRGLHV